MKTLIKKLLREGLIKESMIKTPLYHGTKYNFDKFDLKFFNAGSGDGGWLGRGVYLTNDYEYAESYGNVLECKVNVNNPYIVTDYVYSRSPEKLANDLGVNNSREITSKLIKEGYDSVILTYSDKGYTKDGEYDKFIEICVFNPNNVEVIKVIDESVHSISKNQLFDLEDEILNKIPNNCLYHGSNDISWFNTVKDINTLSNTVNAKSKYLFLTPNKSTALNYSIISNGMDININDNSGVLSFKISKSKGIKLKSKNLKYNSMSGFEDILDKYQDKGYDYVIIEPDGNNYVILNPNILKLISKNYTLDSINSQLQENIISEKTIKQVSLKDFNKREIISQWMLSNPASIYTKFQYEMQDDYYLSPEEKDEIMDMDYDDIHNLPKFKQWLGYEVESVIEDAIDNISSYIKNDGTIPVWRKMTVTDEWLKSLPSTASRLGRYWSFEEDAAEAHWGGSEGNTIKLKAVVPETYIDWQQTITANIDPAIGEDEKEITLFKNTPIRIEELEVNGELVNIDKIKDKIFKV